MGRKKFGKKGWYLIALVSVCAILGLNYGLFHWWGAGVSSGFLDWRVTSFQGYQSGSPQLTTAGQFAYSDGTVNWRGRVVPGNLFYNGSTDLGWMQIGNTSVATQIIWYRGSLLTYLQMRPDDVFPGISIASNVQLGWEFNYMQYNGLGIYIAGTYRESVITANGLRFPGQANVLAQSVPLANVNDILHATIGLTISVDPTWIGQQFPTTFNDATQTFTLSDIWAGTLFAKADSVLPAITGLITQPGTTITGSNFTNPTNPAAMTNSGSSGLAANAVPTSSSGSSLGAIIDTNDPGQSGNHFRKSQVDSVMFQGTDWEAAMGLGDPIALTRADTNASLGTSFEYSLLNDTSRNDVTAWIPLDLAPKTTVTQTTYTFNTFATWDNWGLHCIAQLGNTKTMPTSISVANPFIIHPITVAVVVAANYTGRPLGCVDDPASAYYCATLGPPVVTGSGDAFNPAVTGSVSDVQGSYNGMLEAIGAFLGELGGWIIAVLVIFVVAFMLWRYARPKKGKR